MPERDFEIRLASVLRADAERAVRPFDAVVLAVDAVHAPRMRRLSIPALRLLAFALVAAALAAGALIVAGTRPDDPPAPTPIGPAPVSLGSDGRLLGASTWAADADLTTELGIAGRVHLFVGYGGATASIRGADDRVLLASDVDAGAVPGELHFALVGDGSGCQAGDLGTYRATRSDDSLWIDLAVIGDPCPARAAALARTWHRTLMLASAGGPGLLDPFAPAVRVTLPAGEWSTATFDDGVSIGSNDLGIGLLVMRNPQGVTAPCADGGGTAVDLEPGGAAFAAYLDGLAGVAVATEPVTIGGYAGLRITATWTRSPDCPVTRSMVAWRTSSDETPHLLSGGLTGSDVLIVLDGPGGTYLVGIPEDPSILDSIEFVAELTEGTGPSP